MKKYKELLIERDDSMSGFVNKAIKDIRRLKKQFIKNQRVIGRELSNELEDDLEDVINDLLRISKKFDNLEE